MKVLLMMCALLPPVFAGCTRNTPAKNADVEATPTGPCRDDENMVNGRCVPRIPGDSRPRMMK
ncbi:MAG: hypothetical protein PHS14_13330 [Elusimicrobia bacterium]|nr:hypothetical protein [Elusimicrobiota bacterium]